MFILLHNTINGSVPSYFLIQLLCVINLQLSIHNHNVIHLLKTFNMQTFRLHFQTILYIKLWSNYHPRVRYNTTTKRMPWIFHRLTIKRKINNQQACSLCKATPYYNVLFDKDSSNSYKDSFVWLIVSYLFHYRMSFCTLTDLS